MLGVEQENLEENREVGQPLQGEQAENGAQDVQGDVDGSDDLLNNVLDANEQRFDQRIRPLVDLDALDQSIVDFLERHNMLTTMREQREIWASI